MKIQNITDVEKFSLSLTSAGEPWSLYLRKATASI